FSKKNDDKPDIVLLDILRLMRNNFSLSSIPVLVVPAKSTPVDINYCRTAGASSFFTKPIGFQELNEAVERAL
ncbi:MAG TPA: hypothetical protein DCX53_02950, partial [Anaerolineae bacterium]|nr:hypothetical protein [Anaerolineae bacterium]